MEKYKKVINIFAHLLNITVDLHYISVLNINNLRLSISWIVYL